MFWVWVNKQYTGDVEGMIQFSSVGVMSRKLIDTYRYFQILIDTYIYFQILIDTDGQCFNIDGLSQTDRNRMNIKILRIQKWRGEIQGVQENLCFFSQ